VYGAHACREDGSHCVFYNGVSGIDLIHVCLPVPVLLVNLFTACEREPLTM